MKIEIETSAHQSTIEVKFTKNSSLLDVQLIEILAEKYKQKGAMYCIDLLNYKNNDKSKSVGGNTKKSNY